MSKKPTPDHIRAVFQRYFAAFEKNDLEGIVSLFAPDAVVEDPVGTPPHVGRDAIRAFFAAGFEATGHNMKMAADGAVRVTESGVGACAVICTVPGLKSQVETLDVMTFTEDGLIRTMHAYFGPTNYRPLA